MPLDSYVELKTLLNTAKILPRGIVLADFVNNIIQVLNHWE